MGVCLSLAPEWLTSGQEPAAGRQHRPTEMSHVDSEQWILISFITDSGGRLAAQTNLPPEQIQNNFVAHNGPTTSGRRIAAKRRSNDIPVTHGKTGFTDVMDLLSHVVVYPTSHQHAVVTTTEDRETLNDDPDSLEKTVAWKKKNCKWFLEKKKLGRLYIGKVAAQRTYMIIQRISALLSTLYIKR
jgi:hypothetical protein